MLDFRNVSKLLGGRDIFRSASFRINRGERVGVVGPNGAGKTTLFSLIAGDMTPDAGDVVMPEKIRLGYLRQQLPSAGPETELLAYVEEASGELPAIHAEIEALERRLAETPGNAGLLNSLGELQSRYEHLGGYDMRHRAQAALAGLGFDPETFSRPLASFSGGWQMRASMARVLLGEPDLLLLDEPSNYLDIPAVEWLQHRLKSYEGTLMLISHDRFLLNSLTDVTLEVNSGAVTRYPGGYTYYVKERAARQEQSEAARKNIEKRRHQLQDNINRFRAKATKAAQVQSWIKMLEKIEDAEIPEQLHFEGTIRIPEPPPCGIEAFRLEHVSHTYDGERFIFRDLSLEVPSGEKIGIVGYNGMGKTTLLKIIAGRMQPAEGSVRIGHKVITGYQAQEFGEILPGEKTAFDVVKDAAGGDLPSQRIREILGAFGFTGDSALKTCSVLSGGEKIRLCFARIFVRPPNLLILDEPTTHLDVSAREALQNALLKYPGTVCLVSHDVEFLRGSVTSILEMTRSGIRRYPGGFDYYREKKAEEEAAQLREKAAGGSADAPAASPAGGSTDNNPESQTAVGNRKDLRREKAARRNELAPRKRKLEKEVARLEKIIADGEREKEEIMASFARGDLDPAAIPEKNKRIKEIDYDISRAMLEWEQAAADLEEFRREYDSI